MLELIDKGRCTDAHPAPLLFVHGASLSAWCWDEHFLDFFADSGFRAIAVSPRGHGASTLSQPLNSCSVAAYVDDVSTIVRMLGADTVLIGHSMGCNVVQQYLDKHRARAAVLMAPSTPRGIRRITLRMVRRHPGNILRANTSGSTADLFNTPALAREYLFCAHTPESIVRSCAARMEPESARAGLDQMIRSPDARSVSAPLLVLGATDDGSRANGEVSAAARTYQIDAEFFPNMGHMMMLEPGWQAVTERIEGWLADEGL
jgi:pimeloyl-ACP methyl ester carboxylesterase